MSEVQTRPSAPRGRSSARGGRAAIGSRGGRNGRVHESSSAPTESASASNDTPEIAQMKKQFGGKVSTVKEMFPGWTDEDIVYALQETDGDLELTIEKIAEGSITQFGEVSNAKKDRSKSKVGKDTITSTSGDSTTVTRSGRGGRGAQESGRGGRGRASDRGGRGGRGRAAAVTHTNGTVRPKETSELSVPTEEAWGSIKKDAAVESDDTAKATDSWGATAADAASSATAAVTSAASSLIPDGAKKSWASMFKAAPAPAPEKKAAPPVKAPESEPEPEPEQKPTETVVDILPPAPTEATLVTPIEDSVTEPAASITPSKDELTETNLEQLPDASQPAPTETAASTAASSWDPRQAASSGTPYSSLQPQSAIRPPTSGFAASAQKATGTPGRTPSFQRRVLDQEEAVRMPGNREVDRTAVQFGAFNLGSEDDVDGEREEPETRTQPPQHSPVAHPRASLPPAPTQPTGLPAALPSPKEAHGLPAAPAAAPGLPAPQQPSSQGMSQQGSQSQYGQYGRYGQNAPEPAAFGTGNKQYDPFSQQAPGSQSQYDGYPGQQGQSQSQQQSGAFSSAPSEYSNYYTADQGRGAYAGYYGQQYGQQQSGQSESQQRSASGFNPSSTENTSQYPQTSAAQTQSQSRYATAGEANNSGHTTPNPTAQAQQPGQPGQSQAGHQGQQHSGQPQYPYGHPYYGAPYYGAYMNQYQQTYGGGYGGGPYGKYSQHGYGASPAAPYDHAASPAAGGFGHSSLGRDSAVGGLGDYGRGSSQQSSQGLGGSSAFGGMGDSFGRNSSYQGQGQHYGQQGSQAASGDDLKPFGEGKAANGPSPLLSQAARPGSAANSTPGQSTLPPPQSSQQGAGYGGYPSHLQQGLHGSQTGSQYGSLGGHQGGSGHQTSQYGNYGSGGFGGNNYYGGGQQRGGWGNNYGH